MKITTNTKKNDDKKWERRCLRCAKLHTHMRRAAFHLRDAQFERRGLPLWAWRGVAGRGGEERVRRGAPGGVCCTLMVRRDHRSPVARPLLPDEWPPSPSTSLPPSLPLPLPLPLLPSRRDSQRCAGQSKLRKQVGIKQYTFRRRRL